MGCLYTREMERDGGGGEGEGDEEGRQSSCPQVAEVANSDV